MTLLKIGITGLSLMMKKPPGTRGAEGYRGIIGKLTGKSMVTQMLPTTFAERFIFFFQKSFHIPEPDTVFPARNLDYNLGQAIVPPTVQTPVISGRNRVDGNKIELYLMATKTGDPVCIPAREPGNFTDNLARSEIIRKNQRPLEVILHVGSKDERRRLLGR